MNIRLIICWRPENIFQASVSAVALGRVWGKLYRTELECATELLDLGLLTIMEQEDVLKNDFDWTTKVLTTMVTADSEVLLQSGFVETTPAKPN